MRLIRLFAALTITAGAYAAGPANFSGTWTLDVNRSSMHGHPPPSGEQIVIENSNTHLKYSGHVYDPQEEGDSQYTFEGEIDGKEYPVKMDTGNQMISFKRSSSNSLQSEMHSPDNSIHESATTTISADGKTLTRRITRTTPRGKHSWVEVYTKS